MMNNNVNHPAHYAGSTSIECIEAMKIAFGYQMVYDFCICNAFKYLWRYKNKNGQEDIQKAIWYLQEAETIREYDIEGEELENTFDIRPLWDAINYAEDWLEDHSGEIS